MSRRPTKDTRSRMCDAADHRDAAAFLRRVTPGGEVAANNFERLVGLKDKARYSFLNVSGADPTGAIRRTSQLVEFAREVLQR